VAVLQGTSFRNSVSRQKLQPQAHFYMMLPDLREGRGVSPTMFPHGLQVSIQLTSGEYVLVALSIEFGQRTSKSNISVTTLHFKVFEPALWRIMILIPGYRLPYNQYY